MNRVFVSYPSERLSDARKIATALRAAGLWAWLATDEIPPGADWASGIAEVIPTCQALICLYCRETVDKPYCLEEVRIAFEHSVPRLTIVESFPPQGKFALYLNSGQYLFWTADTLTEHLTAIVDATQRILNREPSGEALMGKIFAADGPMLAALFDRLGVPEPYTLASSAKPVRCLELLEYLNRLSPETRGFVVEAIPNAELHADTRHVLNQLRTLRKNDQSERLSTYISSFWRPRPSFGGQKQKQITVMVGGEGQGKTRALYEFAGSAVESGKLIACGNGGSIPLNHYTGGAEQLVRRLVGSTYTRAERLSGAGIVIDNFDTWRRPRRAREHADALRVLHSTLGDDGFLVISCRLQKWQELRVYLGPLLTSVDLVHLREFTTAEKIRFLRRLVPVEADIGPTIRSGFLMAFGSCQNLVDLGKALSVTGRDAPVKAFKELLEIRIGRLAVDLNLDPSTQGELLNFLAAIAEELLLRRQGRITFGVLARRLGRTRMFRESNNRTRPACDTIIAAFFRTSLSTTNRTTYEFAESWVPVCLLATSASKHRNPMALYLRIVRQAPSSVLQFGIVYWYILLRSVLSLGASSNAADFGFAVDSGEIADAAELLGDRAKVLAGHLIFDRLRRVRPSSVLVNILFRGLFTLLPKLDQLHHLASTDPELMFETLESYIQKEGMSASLLLAIARFLVFEQTKHGVARLVRNHMLSSPQRSRPGWTSVAIQASLFSPNQVRLESINSPRTPAFQWGSIAVEVIRPLLRLESFRITFIKFLAPNSLAEELELGDTRDQMIAIEAVLTKLKKKIIRKLLTVDVLVDLRDAMPSISIRILRSVQKAAWGLAGILIVLTRPALHRILGFRAEVIRDLSSALASASRISGGDRRISGALNVITREAAPVDLVFLAVALAWVRLARRTDDPSDANNELVDRARAVAAKLFTEIAEVLSEKTARGDPVFVAEMAAFILARNSVEWASEPYAQLRLAIERNGCPLITRAYNETIAEIRALSDWHVLMDRGAILTWTTILPSFLCFAGGVSVLLVDRSSVFRTESEQFLNHLMLAVTVLLPIGMSLERLGAVSSSRPTALFHTIGLASPAIAAVLIGSGAPVAKALVFALTTVFACALSQWFESRRKSQLTHLDLFARQEESASLRLVSAGCIAMSVLSALLPTVWLLIPSLLAWVWLLWLVFSLRAGIPGQSLRWAISVSLLRVSTAILKIGLRWVCNLLRPRSIMRILLSPIRIVGALPWLLVAGPIAVWKMGVLLWRGYRTGTAYADGIIAESRRTWE